jgi:hypothetical protein
MRADPNELAADSVLVRHEMQSGRAPLASITPITSGSSPPPEAVAAPRKGPAVETETGFKRNEGGGTHSQQVVLRSEKATGYEKEY